MDLDRFVEVRPGLFRCTIIWPLGLGINIPVSTFLVRGDPLDKSADPAHDWLLVDSGAPMQVATLLKAIDAVLTHEKDTLRYICITHAHIDHTGAATALLEKYPGSKVVIHVEEMPFICEGKSFKTYAVMNIASNPLFSKIPCISGPLVMSTCHWGNAMKSIDKILSLKEDIDTVFPAHDYNVDGVHIDKVHEFHCPPTRL
ncbi:hypothetical protein CPC16_006045 [Podila verticillata]|nr:hypothetical protein CPC16_006045 [Podila verticillata]